MDSRAALSLAVALLAWTGLILAFTLSLAPGGGLYIFLALSERYGGWVLQAYIFGIGAVLAAAGVLLLYGGYHALRGATRRAGLENLAAGILLLGLYAFIYLYSGLPDSFAPLTTLIFIPGILAGLLGLATPQRAKRGRPPTHTLTGSI
ncbi:MAG: hypothetical protein QW587_02825 [Candidatus Bathyarchaeia archaeon]